jgi:hypothetical protein
MTRTHSKASKATSRATPKVTSKVTSRATSEATSETASKATPKAAPLSPERVIRLNPNVDIDGKSIRRTFSDLIFGTHSYIYDLIYYIGDGEEKSCQIITKTRVLKGTISYNSIINTKGNIGVSITKTNFIPILIGDNNEIIHTFDDAIAPDKEGGYSKFVLRSTNNPRYSEEFHALIPNSKTEIESF